MLACRGASRRIKAAVSGEKMACLAKPGRLSSFTYSHSCWLIFWL